VSKNTLATFKHQILHAEHNTPAVVNSVEALWVQNDTLLEYFTSEVMINECEIASTIANIILGNYCIDDVLHFRMRGSSRKYKDEDNESDKCDAFPNASRRRRATIELAWFDRRTSNVDGDDGKDGADADANN
jgi:hypothetical protein